jgi:hypothetical protein
MHMHRKLWEYAFISQALHERGLLAPGRCGLGFAVGQEPLPELFASLGCEILATDLATEEAQARGWTETAQHAGSLEGLNRHDICPPDLFRARVRFRFVNMLHLPDDLGRYDFLWSACSLEHLGTLALGEQFIYESLKYLKPGGVAVHTTEYNLQSNFYTLTKGPSVIYRKRDFKRIAAQLRRRGYQVELDFTKGNMPLDRMPDTPPYKGFDHITLLLQNYVVTSFGLIIESQ